ncbi:PilC/PilY family type IV pilus protein [Pseudomonas sp. 32.2.56]|uniref:pilus assembly protein n=1 Tax=Pseudomonas sp. 32.2.56 TaxID=2969303 RepID=UPI00214FCA12|nr:PilC/PilY family type IV pilus protein [Pseudomonas sp. 32.2.56]MCR4508556.1 PilC/PilY family type IV pilus protein [Pseudomonas sp. 32.2.56]
MFEKKKIATGTLAFSYLFLSLQSGITFADDTEIYLTRELPADQRVRPNIMFVIDTSGSMLNGVPGTNCRALVVPNNYGSTPQNWCTSTRLPDDRRNNGTLTRMEVVKQVVSQLVDELAVSNDSNIGLARFDSNSNGGFINVPVGRAATVASNFKTQLRSYYASGGTPLLESYHEAALYLRGESPRYGNSTRGVIEDGTGARTVNPWRSNSAAFTGSSYKSPIENSCQKSNIIVLTDGLPNGDVGSNSAIQTLVAGKNTQYTSCNRNYPTDGAAADGCWMPGLSEYLANQDNSPAAGKQTINTYTVGFGNIGNSQLLQDTADYGGGKFFTTSDTSGLVSALKSIVVDILAENTSFTTPTVSVSAYSNFGYRNDLYYALFRPAEGARWVGNVKKYKAVTDTTTGDLIVTDVNGRNAVDSSTGFFKDTAQSFWSPSADGRNAESGGAASKLTNPSMRKMFTYTGTTPLAGPGATGTINLTLSSNALNTSNVSKALLGDASMSDDYKTKLISWARGSDPGVAGSPARLQVADVLHNAPKVVAYISDEDLARVDAGNTEDKLVLFYGTNEGHIAAIDPETGAELFVYIPKELLPNLKAYYDNPKGSASKKYGIDGQFGLKVSYGSADAIRKVRPVSEVILYAGMGRGGRNYYALDVSPANSGEPSTIQPKLKWAIVGGTNGTPYQRLGQTWSTPKVSKIKWNGSARDVLIFTGGYDPNQDDDTPNTPSNDSYGNALYIADANTGERLWMAGPNPVTGETSPANLRITSMTNSIPADPTLIDITGDGLIDTIFVADTRGQLFRFDLDPLSTGASNLATGGRVANFGGTTALDNRRFYNAPDVALIKERGKQPFYTIALGSGYRGHPLNEDTIDRFYVIRDTNVAKKPATYVTITESDMVDVSSIDPTGTTATDIQNRINGKRTEIATLTAAEAAARDALSNYQLSVGYIAKQQALLQTNNDINSKQEAIEAIISADPFIVEHATEMDARTQLNNLIVETLDGLKSLNALSAPVTHPNAQAFLAAQLSNANTADWGQLHLNLQVLNTTPDTEYQAVVAAEDALKTARANNQPDTTALEVSLASAVAAHEASSAFIQRQEIVDNQSELGNKLNQILALQNSIFQTLINNDATDVSADLAALDTLKTEVSSLIPGLSQNATGPTTNSDILSVEAATRQSQADSVAISTPLNSEAARLSTLQSEQTALNSQAASQLADLAAISDKPYDGSEPALTPAQVAAATAADVVPPLSIFDAFNYLIEAKRLEAVNRIPTLRNDINELYAQLSPGNSYVPDLSALNNSKGWFMRFPIGEKVLSSSISFRGAVLFSTFRPSGQQVTTCGPDVGRGRFYALNLTDATSIFTETISGVATDKRGFDLTHGGIPPQPAVILREDGRPGLLCGAERCEGGEDDGIKPPPKCKPTALFCDPNAGGLKPTYWREN